MKDISEWIQHAQQSGWKCPFRSGANGKYSQVELGGMFINPLAHQAVGRACGWDKDKCDGNCSNVCREHLGQFQWCDNPGCKCRGENKNTHYKAEMHRLIDMLAEASQSPNFSMEKTLTEYVRGL